jgi:hypothetical protein
MAVPVWICQLPAGVVVVEAGGVLGKPQPRRQARGRSAMEARVRIEEWYSGGRVRAKGIVG